MQTIEQHRVRLYYVKLPLQARPDGGLVWNLPQKGTIKCYVLIMNKVTGRWPEECRPLWQSELPSPGEGLNTHEGVSHKSGWTERLLHPQTAGVQLRDQPYAGKAVPKGFKATHMHASVGDKTTKRNLHSLLCG